jgi:hypothetical protein
MTSLVHLMMMPNYDKYTDDVGYTHMLGVRIRRICMFFGLPDPDPLVRGTDPDPDPDPSLFFIKVLGGLK